MKIVSRDEALEAGKKRYFTGKACRHGHVCERLVSTYICVACGLMHAKANAPKYAQRIRAYQQDYVARNSETSRARSRAWRQENPERAREGVLAWINASAENRESVRVNVRNRKARVRSAGKHTADDILAIEKAQRGRCAYCRVKLRKGAAGRHVDHIQPISRGGSNNRQNLQLLCPPCNMTKHARDPIDFARSINRLI